MAKRMAGCRRENGLEHARRNRDDPLAFVANRAIFGDLADDKRFVAAYQSALASLHERRAGDAGIPALKSRAGCHVAGVTTTLTVLGSVPPAVRASRTEANGKWPVTSGSRATRPDAASSTAVGQVFA
jgi:hypothetical protein